MVFRLLMLRFMSVLDMCDFDELVVLWLLGCVIFGIMVVD